MNLHRITDIFHVSNEAQSFAINEERVETLKSEWCAPDRCHHTASERTTVKRSNGYTVTTGKLVTRFQDADAAAVQIGLLQQRILELENG